MWDFSSRTLDLNETGTFDCAMQTSVALKTYENDALMIARRIARQIKNAEKRQRNLVAKNDIAAAKLKRHLNVLWKRKETADRYLERVRRLQETEILVKECKAMNIDPSARIIAGGGTLKKSAEELERFYQEPIPFQEFDRDYDLN